jgi:SAM-dependent methyltransferase
MKDRYWFDNSLADEGNRLRLLEAVADPRSTRLLDQLRVGEGWRCVELGAGGGSIASWLARRVGATGTVLAVDRNVTLLHHLAGRSNVEIVEASIEDLDFAPASVDLIHTRNTLMHLEGADDVIAKLVDALRPGGVLLLEEADYFPLAGMTSPALAEVATALVSGWTWARTIPTTLSRLPVTDLDVTVDTSMLRGGSAEAAFWAHTFRAVEDRLTDPAVARANGAPPVSRETFEAAMALLGDEGFWTPFAAVVCVSCRRE